MLPSLHPTPPGTPPNGAEDMGSEEIPMPPGLPIMGNVRDIDPAAPVQSLNRLAEQYGDIYRMNVYGTRFTVISNNQLINEVCNEKRFSKNVNSALRQVRNGVHDGLFTAFHEEEASWGKAHRILTSAFGPLSIRTMYDDMHDIASQLTMKWARMGPSEPIHVTDDFTRLALDTLALCAMDYRFNSFYSAEMHPFVEAMGSFLYESGQRSRRAPLPAYWYRKVDEKYFADIATMRAVSDGVLKARKEQGTSERKDLLQAMLNGKDPRTGEKLDDASITNNLITFLIAGHETTSGMLSFAFYNLIRHPEAYRKAQQEVDDVCGTGPISVEQLSKLKYVAAVLRETLRVSSPIPAIAMTPLKDETLAGGKYFIPAGQNISLLLYRAHLDPAVFGDDAKEFKPERMLDENFERLNREFPNSWKPFGNGARACIGRPFAWQEALLVMAMLLQNFNFRFDDPSYQLHIKETLTIKPDGFYMRAQLRDGLTATKLERRLAGSAAGSSEYGKADQAASADLDASSELRPMSIYYGSNSGTCEAMANRVGADAPHHGFKADVIAPLDNTNQSLPTDRPVVIVTASYEGQPPDNAGHFISWLQSLKEDEGAKGVSYAVFACGHRDWAQTYHRIPKLVDTKLAACGAERLAEMGGADASGGNMFEDFEAWEDNVLFPALKAKYGAGTDAAAKGDGNSSGLSVEVTTPRASTLRQDVREAVVLATHELNPGCTEGGDFGRKRHVEIQLPSNMTYTAGDYLAVLPFNNRDAIARAMRRFNLPWDANVVVKTPDGTATSSTQTNLPINTPLPAYGVVGAYVELGQPATKRNVLSLGDWAGDEITKKALTRLASDDYATEISAKKVNILDLLDRFPTVELPFGDFLTLLPPMRVRQYSISSSPLWKPNHVTLSYAVLTAPSLSGNGLHEGVASHYLSSVQPGDRIHVAVRPSHHAFHLPHDAENVPIICVAAGTGLAPFRGFIQERAAMLAAGRTVAPGFLFYGSRGLADDIYREEFDRWQTVGAVDVRRAYSRAQSDAEKKEAESCKYVQDRLYHDRAVMKDLWKKGARMYVCGSRQVGEGVKEIVLNIRREWMEEAGSPETEEDAEAWFSSIRNERYATDVFD
ncbi:bifunctional p-450 nadph-p450 reductase [Ophiostoma piceae UAMH 11346]|uniref:Bifunctional cytochrome P450/NADPH--P450 reductase n=1 Tax=Ophiostoma piceae (strain UAMH 11346) TaxID=1262450 RepID=S3BZ97_OPHP1|nr:bifunctional p-450 nadph-p450 reductase [Ophiostoma piceae UAMH 11346]